MKTIQLWSVPQDATAPAHPELAESVNSTETEERLEDLLVESPDLLLEGLTLIGRQLPTEGGPLDLLGVDEDGELVLFELKRGTLTREAVAQILDYASDLRDKDPDQLAHLVEGHSGKNGIDRIEDFHDWHSREYPSAPEVLSETPRMVLVGLGADPRATRIVNLLADSGINIQLLTFHAFRSGSQLLLARQVETEPPTPPGGYTKEGNLENLLALASKTGAKDLLEMVADFIDRRMPCYRWPGKTAYSFSLQDRTAEGRPSNRTYMTLWVNQKRRGSVLLTLPPRVVEMAPATVEAFLSEVQEARQTDSQWTPVELVVSETSWDSVSAPLTRLLDGIVEAWRTANAEVQQTD